MTDFELRPVVPSETETPGTENPPSTSYPAAAPPPAAPPLPHIYPPPYGAYPVLPPFNTYAILAAIFAFVVFPPLGTYFGHKAKQQIAQTGERGIELAKVGIIGGWIVTCLQGAFLIVWCGMFLTFFTTFISDAAQVP